QPVGTCTVFEKAVVDAVQIVGIQIESRLISRAGALRLFATNMAAGVTAAFV
ncbi:restriction endonuclease, partial [Vibrio anguillarum]|nr:restriction endonuclease [Vibrio anguillarum]